MTVVFGDVLSRNKRITYLLTRGGSRIVLRGRGSF